MAPVSTDLLDVSFVGGSFGQKHTPMTLGVTGAIYSATTLNISKQVPGFFKDLQIPSTRPVEVVTG